MLNTVQKFYETTFIVILLFVAYMARYHDHVLL